jgi:hypothetical protein
LLAARGQVDAGRLLFDEVAAKHHLQLPHVRADGGLGQVEQLRSLGEAAELMDCNERAQQLGRNVDLDLPELGLAGRVGVEDDVGSSRTRSGHLASALNSEFRKLDNTV